LKNLLTISQPEFEQALPSLSLGTLKNLIEGLRGFQQGKKFLPDLQIQDLQRKETKIWKEFQRRGLVSKHNKKDSADFLEWSRQMRHKKVIF